MIDVCEFLKDVFRLVERGYVFGVYSVNRAFRHRSVDAFNVVDVIGFSAHFVDGVADDDLEIVAILLVKRVERVENLLELLFIIPVLFLGKEYDYMPFAYLEQPYPLEVLISELSHGCLNAFGQFLPLFIERPHVQAHEHEVLLVVVVILDQVPHYLDIVCAEHYVVRV